MITAAQWVPRGFAAPFPQKYTLDEAEYERIAGLAKLQLDDAEEDLKEAQQDGSDKGGDEDEEQDKMQVEEDKSSKKSKCVTTSTAGVRRGFADCLAQSGRRRPKRVRPGALR